MTSSADVGGASEPLRNRTTSSCSPNEAAVSISCLNRKVRRFECPWDQLGLSQTHVRHDNSRSTIPDPLHPQHTVRGHIPLIPEYLPTALIYIQHKDTPHSIPNDEAVLWVLACPGSDTEVLRDERGGEGGELDKSSHRARSEAIDRDLHQPCLRQTHSAGSGNGQETMNDL
jgi:hypothetical protein